MCDIGHSAASDAYYYAHTHLLGSNLIVWSEGMGLYYRTCFFLHPLRCILPLSSRWLWTLGMSCRNRQEGPVVANYIAFHNEHVGCPDFLSAGWCVCSRCANWSRLEPVWQKEETGKERERPVHCGVRWIFKDSWQRQHRKKMPGQNFTVSSPSILSVLTLLSPSFVLLFRKYGLNEIHWLALVWSSLPRQQLSGWGALGHPRWEPKCIKHNPEQIMCKRKTAPK